MSDVKALFGLIAVSYTHLDVYKRQGRTHREQQDAKILSVR